MNFNAVRKGFRTRNQYMNTILMNLLCTNMNLSIQWSLKKELNLVSFGSLVPKAFRFQAHKAFGSNF